MSQVFPQLTLVEPRFIINTAFKSGNLAKYLSDNNIQDCYEKPMPKSVLYDLLKQAMQ